MEPHLAGLFHHTKRIELNQRQMKFSIVAIVISVLLFAAGLWLTINRYQGAIQTSDSQIESLFSEIGEMREQNERLAQDLATTRADLDSFLGMMDAYSKASGKGGFSINSADFEKMVKNGSGPTVKKADSGGDLVYLQYPEEVKNILILGTHGSLTDTIIVASVNPVKSTVTLISIPRDLYVLGRKVNAIYNAYGVKKLESELSAILGLDIDYYVVVDLKGFVKIVDAFGGLTVDVPKAIYDASYPTPNKGYQLFSIDAGTQVMDGETALKYARSRKSTSDFDRSKRQQLIIKSARDALLSGDTLSSPKKLAQMYNSLQEYIHTDIDVFTLISFATSAKNYTLETGNVIDTSNYLYSTTSTAGAYILLPLKKGYDDVKAFVYEQIVK